MTTAPTRSPFDSHTGPVPETMYASHHMPAKNRMQQVAASDPPLPDVGLQLSGPRRRRQPPAAGSPHAEAVVSVMNARSGRSQQQQRIVQSGLHAGIKGGAHLLDPGPPACIRNGIRLSLGAAVLVYCYEVWRHVSQVKGCHRHLVAADARAVAMLLVQLWRHRDERAARLAAPCGRCCATTPSRTRPAVPPAAWRPPRLRRQGERQAPLPPAPMAQPSRHLLIAQGGKVSLFWWHA